MGKQTKVEKQLGELVGYYFTKIMPSNQVFPTEDALEFIDKIQALIQSAEREAVKKFHKMNLIQRGKYLTQLKAKEDS